MLNLPLAPLWAKLLRIPRPYLYAGILFFASLGAYSVNFQAFDLRCCWCSGCWAWRCGGSGCRCCR